MVGPDSTGISRAPAYSGLREGSRQAFAYGAITLCGMLSQYISTGQTFCNFPVTLRGNLLQNPQPQKSNDRSLDTLSV